MAVNTARRARRIMVPAGKSAARDRRRNASARDAGDELKTSNTLPLAAAPQRSPRLCFKGCESSVWPPPLTAGFHIRGVKVQISISMVTFFHTLENEMITINQLANNNIPD